MYRAELHKRALQWERATAYLEPSKARGIIMDSSFGRLDRDLDRLPRSELLEFDNRGGPQRNRKGKSLLPYRFTEEFNVDCEILPVILRTALSWMYSQDR